MLDAMSTSNSLPNVGASHVYGHESSNRRCLLYISPALMNGVADGNHHTLTPSTPFVAYCCPSRKAHSASLYHVPLYLNSPSSRRPSPLVFALTLSPACRFSTSSTGFSVPPLVYPCRDPDCTSAQCVWQTVIPSRYVAPASKCANLSFCVSA